MSFNTVQVKTKGTNVETRRRQKEQHTCHVCNIRYVWEGQRKANLIAVTVLTDTQLKLPVLGSALPQEEVLKCRKQPHNALRQARGAWLKDRRDGRRSVHDNGLYYL